ncbi:MAG: 3-phosphoshikimate 1-carboxyvinyltransferase [Bacteroidetes bacterium]|nr:MAG: 3-phosphoshikimate 1-carboxyvinyltransferase [Bacteroidota bacterium]
MIKKVELKGIKGNLQAPASKSVAQRAIAIAALAEGTSSIFHPGESDDVRAAIGVAEALGVALKREKDRLIITGGIKAPFRPLDCGESGLGIRMFSAVAATLDQEVILEGSGSLARRPMDMIEKSLKAAAVQCKTTAGLQPVVVKGPYPGGILQIDGSVSSQVLTGLLIAAPYANSTSEFVVKNLKSKPYIDITCQMMKDFGAEVINNDYKEFTVPAPSHYKGREYIVEGDWSGAAFWLVAGAIGGEITMDNLMRNSAQADKAIIEALVKCGATLSQDETRVYVKKSDLKAFEFDATHCPDLFPPLVVLAAACKGTTAIKGVSRLRVKESDRAMALQQEFGKLGVEITLEKDMMFIKGGKLKSAEVHSHHDHRIAMAAAIASLLADGPVTIHEAQAVNKSYPGFFDDMEEVRG